MIKHSRRYLIRRLLATLIILLLFACGLVWARGWRNDQATEKVIPEPKSPPLSYSQFNPSRIISDTAFTDWQSLNEDQIQAFLDDWGYGCRPGGSEEKPVSCLKDFRGPLPAQPANRYCPTAVTGGTDLSAAQMISGVARACRINPQVILVTLQKEQGLITASSYRLTPRRYEIAMGYGCPDHQNCDSRFYGLGRQIYFAAQQWQRYRARPENYDFRAKQTAQIAYGPNQDCGKQTVYIENWATAALYNYTPYVPTEDAKLGLFNECNQAGNLNFFAFYQAWFGNQPDGQPLTREKAFAKKQG